MQNERLQELKRLAEAASVGPWRWELNEGSKSIALVGGRPQFDKTVMDFTRWGMGSAAPRFNDAVASGEFNIMERAETYAAAVPGREHHANWFKTIAHPDAAWIAAANPATVLELIAIAESRAAVAAATDLTKMLREKAVTPFGPGDHSLLTAAADEIDRLAAQQAQAAPTDSAAKAVHWFGCLEKCARMLDLPEDEPIPSGVAAAVERLTATPAQSPASPQEAKDAALEVATAALKRISEWRFGWDGDCGVTAEADSALAAIDAAMSAPAEPQPSAAGGAQTYEQIMDELDAAAVTKSIARNRAKR